MSKFKISVIIPVYNVEEYLEETIQSVINQTIGFENIQMILVNDGSPDNSEEICLRYRDMYPDNILYINQKNAGVSAARNNGFKYATGEFINFLDSDDKYSKNAYKVGYDMLTQNDNLDIVSYRMMFFDAKTGPHNLDFKFGNEDRIIDLREEPYNPVYHVTSVLIKKSLIDDVEFDTRLKISEDVKYLCDLLVKTKRIGLISSECFYYRRRKNETSAIQTSSKKPTYFWDTPKYCFEHILDLSKKYKDMKSYLSYVVVYDLKWRIFEAKTDILSKDEKIMYKENIRRLLNRCDDEVICAQESKNLSKVFRELDFKYGKSMYNKINIKNGYLRFDNINVLAQDKIEIDVYNLFIEDDKLIINALFDYSLNNNFELFAKVDNKYIKFDKKYINEDPVNLYSSDMEYKMTYFDLKIDLKEISKIEFYIEIDKNKCKVNPKYTHFSKLNNLKYSYYKKDRYTLIQRNNSIIINPKEYFLRIKYLAELLINKKDILSFGILLLHYITYPFVRHDNWLLCDREDVAGDNAEVLFTYIKENTEKKNVYFCLNKNSKDIDKIKNIGKVVNFKTMRFYLLYLHSEFVMSSHIDNFIHLPFGRKQIYLNNVLDRKFIFLQHGIIKDDFSMWLKKYNKNISLFITSVDEEYKSILNENYMYDKNVIKLTGLPRYDRLCMNDVKEENLIIFCPTWRKSLVGVSIPGTQRRPYRPEFKNSEYFKFYNELVTNKKLRKVLKDQNYKILFCLHPSFKAQISDFKSDEYVDFQILVDYPSVFKRAKLMVTDYSSVAHDFAYLKKPIVYTQFDIDTFSITHTYTRESTYDYNKSGFGDIAYDLDSSIDKIIEVINGGCKMNKKYVDRVNKYFKFKDNKNCERVYNEIVKLSKK